MHDAKVRPMSATFLTNVPNRLLIYVSIKLNVLAINQ